ncbi:MAG: cation transporter [Bifidobacteriaceae bacterium]|nr:cation transporter [Bifidobacteriaceae bacterium]
MQIKRVEHKALILGISVNCISAFVGLVVYFMTGLQAMFLDMAFTAISVLSGFIAALVSKKTVKVTERFPNGFFALEPLYAICKAILTLSLLMFSLIDVTRVAYDYFALGIGETTHMGIVILYEIFTSLQCAVLFWYYNRENRKIHNSSTMLNAESNSTFIDGCMSFGIGVAAAFLYLLPHGTPLEFLHYTADFFITGVIIILTVKEPLVIIY